MKKIISSIATMIVLQANAQNVGIGTSTPQARLHVADSSVFFSSPSSSTSGTTPAQNGGIGMLWVGGKAALRVGRETGTNWAYDNIGDYSSSFGFNNSVPGVGSFASGNDNTVSDNYSVALGSYNYARNQRTLAFGNYSRGLGDFSNAIGYNVASLAFQSTALGRFNVLSGNTSSEILSDPILVVGNGTADNNRSNALTILKNGNVGIGTVSPSSPLQIATSNSNNAFYVTNVTTSAVPGLEVNAIYASQSNAFGAAINAWSSADGGVAPNRNDFAFAMLAQAGSNRYGVGAFSINKSAVLAVSNSGTAVEAESTSGLAINSKGGVRLTQIGEASGKVLITDATGNATWQNPPKITLDQSSATGQSAVEFRNQGGYVGSFGWSQSSARYFLYDGNTNTNPLVIKDGKVGMGDRNPTTNMLEVNGNASKSTAGDWLANSDARLKKNMEPISGALNKIQQLQGITYQWNDDKTGINRPETAQMGFTAQNIQQVFPELVSKDAQGYLQTGYGTYDALYVEAIKELMKKIDVLEEKIKLLEQK